MYYFIGDIPVIVHSLLFINIKKCLPYGPKTMPILVMKERLSTLFCAAPVTLLMCCPGGTTMLCGRPRFPPCQGPGMVP